MPYLRLMREETWLRYILEVIRTFDGQEPMARHLKKYFGSNRKLGSRDRKLIREMVYTYYRIGKAAEKEAPETRLALALLACGTADSEFRRFILSKAEGMRDKAASLDPAEIFPMHSRLSEAVSGEDFIRSLLVKPRVWIRVRKNFSEDVERELQEMKIPFEKQAPVTWSFDNSAPLDKLIAYEKGYFEIQDYASQQTLGFIRPQPGEYWWDACAGAGGKSLMMADAEPSIKLRCSDSRKSILENLKQRFAKAGIINYTTEELDLTDVNVKPDTNTLFDGIIADVPCSGSGTWARTPESVSFFREASLKKFQFLQQKIVSSLVPFIVPGKVLIYVTCSVFTDENETNVDFFQSDLPLKLERSGYLEGYRTGADTLFAARFVRV